MAAPKKYRLLFYYLPFPVISILLWTTGYHFRFALLDILVHGISIGYPVFWLLRRADALIRWALLLLVFILLIANASHIFLYLAFSKAGYQSRKEEWNLKNYTIRHSSGQDWAGPPYQRYELFRNRLGGILIKQLSTNQQINADSHSCEVEFTWNPPQKKVLYFDRCRGLILRVIE